MPITTPLLSYLQDTSKIVPMLLIETPTTLGRTYQGYKRGGKTEGREKICEETLGAAVWLFGVKAFNKIGDFIGEKILGLKDLDTDVGKDSLRNPFGYVKDKKTATAIFKFSKIIGSVVLGTVAMGMIVPRIKMAMSNAIRKKDGLEPYPDKNSKNGEPTWADKLVGIFIKGDNRKKLNPENITTMKSFVENSKSGNPVSFKGGGSLVNGLLFASHNLENNTIWRLLSTDAGMIAGRVANSRTKKEGIEYFTRDSASSLFYVFAAPLFSGLLRKILNVPNVNPKAADATAEYFKTFAGSSLQNNFFSSKIPSKEMANNFINGINFSKSGVIKLDELLEVLPENLKDKAIKMSKLQPEYISKDGTKAAILSKKQVTDIFSESEISDPEFLKSTISKATKGKSDDIKAFVSRKRLEKIRTSLDDYAVGLEKYAKNKSKDGLIDKNLIDKYTKNLNRKNLLIHMAGIGFAVFGLAYLIPKFQYFVSEKITGEKEFLGSFDKDKEQQPKAQ